MGPVERRATADSADLNPARDTTIQSDFMDRSNGSGPNVFSGRTGSHGLRRALLAFDTVSGVPRDSIVTSAVFRLYMNKTVFGASDYALHKLLSDWGEAGSSNTLGEGAPAQPGDATWTNTFFNTGTWSSVGGDFSALTTAVQTVNGNGSYTWVSSQLVADVQAWVIAPSSDFGWILVGDEANIFTAKRFDSRESDTVSRRPLLTVGFIPPPDLKIWKSAMPDPVIAGSNITYTVTVSNCGPRDATGVTIMDALSDDLLLVSGNANTNIGALLIGASTTVVYQAHVAASALNTITNSAAVSSDTQDAIPSNDVASVTTVVNTLCDLSLRKQAAGPGIVGQAAVQVVIVTNAGPSDAQNVHVVDMLPECVLFLSATAAGACTYSQGVVNCDLGTVPAGGSASAFIRVEYLVDGTYTNIATVTTDTTETSLLNNTTQAVTRISAAALFDGPDATYGPVHLGDGRDGSLTVSNTWYVDTSSSVLSSNAAVGGSKISVTDASAFKTGDELLLLAVQGSVSNAGLYEFSFVQEVSGNMLTLSSTLQNGYLPSGGSIVVQRVPHFDSVTVLSNGVLTARDWNGTNGGIIAFRVANQLDIQPGGAVSADGIGFRGGAGVVSTNESSERPDNSGWQGESFVGLGMQDNTNANHGGGGAGLYEPAPPSTDAGSGGGGASYVTAGTRGLDKISASIDHAGGHRGLLYGTNTLSQLLPGSGGGSGGHDKDNFLSDPNATASGKGGNGGGIILIAAESVLFDGSLSALGDDGDDASGFDSDELGGGGGGSGGSILIFLGNTNENVVASAVSGGSGGRGGRTDDVNLENRGGDGGTGRLVIATARRADLSVSKRAGAGPHLLGQDMTYTITVTNSGPDDASGVIVVDFLPPGVTFLSVTSDLCQCAISNDVVRCDTETNAIPAGSGAGVEILVRLDMVTVLTNKAIVTSGSALDPDVQDNIASIETTVLPAANLALTKTGPMVSIVAGSNLTYLISVSNAGPSTADNVVIVDSLPPGVLLQAGSTNVSLGSLSPGNSTSVVLQVTVNPGTLGMITNTASANSDTGDPYPANNMDTVETTIIALADLSIEKLASANPVIAGSNMTYTISVTNNGPSDALDVLVADMLPAGLTPTGSVMSNLGAIVAGGSSQFMINVGVSPAALGPITNIATLTSLTADPNTTNNTDAEVTAVIVVSDLAVSLSDMPDPAIAGSNVYYIAAITNEGPSDATNIFAWIGVPAGTSTNALPSAWQIDTNFPGSGATVVAIPIESMVAGASTSVTLCLNIDPSFLGTLTNSVIVTVSTDPDSPFAGFDQVETFVSAAADIQLFKTASTNPVVSGLGLMYSLVVSNSGPSVARNVIATDPLPSGVVPNDVVVTNLGNIAPGGYVLVDIPVIVKPGLATGALLTNTASASSAAADAAPANNVATVVVSVVAISDLGITKEDSPDPVVDSGVLVYTITVSNAGPSDAANVLLSDEMPSGITPSGSIVTNIGCLRAGAVTSIVITVQVHGNTTGTITNRAEVSSASTDTNTAGNIVFEDTTIPDFDGDGEADFSDADDDNDGMPDDFENEHDLDPKDGQDADDDPDMDTHSNLEEYIADTDPTNGLSFFNVSALAVTNSIRVFFDSSTGRVYTLQYIDDLAGGFFTNYPEHTGKPGQGGTDSFLDTNNAPDRYYRIEVELP